MNRVQKHGQQLKWQRLMLLCLPRPPGVTSQAVFHVVNNGYDNLELRVALPQDKEHAPLQVGNQHHAAQAGAMPHMHACPDPTSPPPQHTFMHRTAPDSTRQHYQYSHQCIGAKAGPAPLKCCCCKIHAKQAAPAAPPQVTFPEGTIIGLAKSRVPVHVSFSSPRPLAVTSAIDLLDEAGMRYSMPVTAITDNSLATHVAFWEVSHLRAFDACVWLVSMCRPSAYRRCEPWSGVAQRQASALPSLV